MSKVLQGPPGTPDLRGPLTSGDPYKWYNVIKVGFFLEAVAAQFSFIIIFSAHHSCCSTI